MKDEATSASAELSVQKPVAVEGAKLLCDLNARIGQPTQLRVGGAGDDVVEVIGFLSTVAGDKGGRVLQY